MDAGIAGGPLLERQARGVAERPYAASPATETNGPWGLSMTQITLPREVVEQLVDCPASDYERMYDLKKQLRKALANAEPTGFSLTKTSTSTVPRTVESIFEAMDKEVAAGRLVRTGPFEWTRTP